MPHPERLHALDAVRAFALLIGIVFHSGFSFIPGLIPGSWAAIDSQPSTGISVLLFTAHIFRMPLFFFMAGLFARLMFRLKGDSGFWRDRLRRIVIPFIVGWLVLYPLLTEIWLWGYNTQFGHRLIPPFLSVPPPPLGVFRLTHLWFLYYLLLMYVLFFCLRIAVTRVDRRGQMARLLDAVVQGLVRTRLAALVLALPACAILFRQHDWLMWFGIPTPEISLRPVGACVGIFGEAFAFGWLIQRQMDLLKEWARDWPLHLAIALATTAWCLSIVGTRASFAPVPHNLKALQFAFSYGLSLWCWVFAITGIAVRFLSRESPTWRYLADSSYWLYLMHLPLIAVMQVLVAPLDLDPFLKLILVLAPSLAVLFASYQWLVRYTAIGERLNGPRKRPQPVLVPKG